MKKIMWTVAIIPVFITSVVLQFMPERIPMHHDFEGNTDRWGSKMECFVFPIIILLITLFWHFLINLYETKALKSKTEKEEMEAKSAMKVLGVVGITQAAMFGIMHVCILYSSYIQSSTGSLKSTLDIGKISCILCGVMFIVLGNYMTKAKMNSTVGLRTVWSMHNDNTWRKSNRFAAIALMIAGLLTVVTTVFVNTVMSTVFMLVYIVFMTIVSVAYSHKVYNQEIAKNI